ncbi:unnamed protein product [Brassica oleracea]
MFKEKKTEKEKRPNLSTLLFPSMAIEGKNNRKEQIDASSPSMAIEGSEININTGKYCNDGLKIFNDEGNKSDLETKSNRWLETRKIHQGLLVFLSLKIRRLHFYFRCLIFGFQFRRVIIRFERKLIDWNGFQESDEVQKRVKI